MRHHFKTVRLVFQEDSEGLMCYAIKHSCCYRFDVDFMHRAVGHIFDTEVEAFERGLGSLKY